MDYGKIRDAHKEHLIKGDAKIIDGANPEGFDVLHKHGDDPVKEIKVTQDAVHNLHDKCTVTPVKGLSELVKRMLRFTLLIQDIGEACNGRNP